jgi:outer membrane protein
VAAIRRAEAQVLAERANLLAVEQTVLADAVNAYVTVIQNQEVLRLTTNNVRVLERQLQAARDRFRVGEITRTDVAQAEARLERARSERSRADGDLQTARSNFERTIGEPPRQLTAPPPLRPIARDAEEAARLAEANNPNVLRARFDEQAAIHNIDVIFGELLPTAVAPGQHLPQRRQHNARHALDRQPGPSVALRAALPGRPGTCRVRQAKQEAQRAQRGSRRGAAQVVDNARRAWETLQAARAEVNARTAQIRANEIALEGVQREALVGSRTTLDVLNAEQELLDMRAPRSCAPRATS